MFWCTSYQFMMIYQWNHVKMNQDPWWRALRTQSICCNYDENVIHVWSLGIVYHIKHAWRSLLEQTNMFWCVSYQFMMIYQWNHVKINQDPWWSALHTQSIYYNYDENMIHVWSLGIVYHIKHSWASLLE